MDSRELKFVLKLLGSPDYQAPIASIKPNLRTKASERDSLCRVLRDRGLVDCDEQVTRFRLAPAGRALLKLDTQRLPVSADEITLLQAGCDGSVEVKDVPLAGDRLQTAIGRALDRGFIKAEKTTIETVWLTQRGLDYLREEFTPSGTALELSLDHLADYLRFLRKFQTRSPEAKPARAIVENLNPSSLPETSSPVLLEPVSASSADPQGVTPPLSVSSTVATPPPPVAQPLQTSHAGLTSDQLYDLIAQLDRQYNTHNYLPIYHLRDRLHTVMDREMLDQALYALQREDRLELSSLQEAAHYTPEQINAGIPQDIGGPLFFLIRT
ncbi:MAG: hypothetical protein EAZ61_02345 [Oscillatoriales cyanobacterium]|nr:MAG: hypothetical protein EAZ61_02345 [Oscillatoriales cyanobacterium]